MIKRFEKFQFNEDWEEEEPLSNKGPFDDLLEYGADGPKFKCGDRVQYNGGTYDNINKNGKIGTIVNYSVRFNDYYICFDDEIYDDYDDDEQIFNIPLGHADIVQQQFLKLF